VPVNEVVAHLLASQLVHLRLTGAIRIKKVDLHGLSRKVEKILDAQRSTARNRLATFRSLDERSPRKKSADRATGRYAKRTPTAKSADLRDVSDDDVRRAIQDVYSRTDGTGTFGKISATDVVTDLLADRLVPHLDADPDLMNFDGDDLRDLSDEVQNVLPDLRLDSPWRRAIGPVYRVETVRTVLRLESVDDVLELASKRAILMLRTSDGHEVFPRFQFSDGHPLPGLAEVLQAGSADFEHASWTAAAWLRTPLELLNGGTIVDALIEDHIEAAAEAATMLLGGH
jgi:hypothetical protein